MVGLNTDFALRDLAQRYASYLRKKFSAVLQQSKFRNTDELMNSLEIGIIQHEGMPAFTMRFALHGKFIDIKKMYWTKPPPIDAIMEWIDSKGLSRFKRIPGYSNSSPMNPEKVKERLAWSIAMSKKLDFKHKQKKWKQDNLGVAVAYLAHMVAEEFAKQSAKAIVQPLIRN